jgi:hypothetical protein
MSQSCTQPEMFRPERFMDEANLTDPLTTVFGFGRRYDLSLTVAVA